MAATAEQRRLTYAAAMLVVLPLASLHIRISAAVQRSEELRPAVHPAAAVHTGRSGPCSAWLMEPQLLPTWLWSPVSAECASSTVLFLVLALVLGQRGLFLLYAFSVQWHRQLVRICRSTARWRMP